MLTYQSMDLPASKPGVGDVSERVTVLPEEFGVNEVVVTFG